MLSKDNKMKNLVRYTGELRRFNPSFVLGTIIVLGIITAPANAGSFTFYTQPGATESGGNPADATATFTTGAGSITVVVSNLEANPLTIAQNISDFFFTLSDTPGFTATSATPSGDLICIGVSPCNTTTIFNWALTATGKNVHVDSLAGAGGPSETIIGPAGSGGYTKANASITGNDPHNPFLDGPVTFTLNGITGVTAATIVTAAMFSFGTAPGNDVPGVPGGPGDPTPEPASLLLGCIGVVFLAFGKIHRGRH
jgi:hypothetical protein